MAGIEQTNGSGAPRGKRITGRSRNPTGPLGLRLRTGSGPGAAAIAGSAAGNDGRAGLRIEFAAASVLGILVPR